MHFQDSAWGARVTCTLSSIPLPTSQLRCPKPSHRLMGNLCCSTATVSPLPPPPPRMTPATPAPPAPVLSRPRLENSPVPSSRPPSRSRSRTASKPESTHRSGMSSQGSNFQSSEKSAPQPPQSSKSTSLQSARTVIQSVAAPRRSNRSDFKPTGPGESDGWRAMTPR